MYEICRHIRTNGLRCQSPALKGSAYCYYHVRVHRTGKTSSGLWDDVKLPVLEDASTVQLALSEVVSAMLSSRLDARRAGLLLYALQIASQNLSLITQPAASETVRLTTLSGDGEDLAPVKTVCEPADCLACPQRFDCKGESLAQPPQPTLSLRPPVKKMLPS